MPRTGYDEVVLLTGFPSFPARKMCEELLRAHRRTLVHAIVHPKFADDAREALDELTKTCASPACRTFRALTLSL
jgi:hypothetical protein